MLAGKKILLGITGSIAAYKAAFLVRLLIKEGAEVQVVMTKSAIDFITPLTLATLSKKPVLYEYFDEKSGDWNNHVALGLWADLMIIAPLSANTLGKMANGICDNLLLATYLSAKCPVLVAPAMDLDMYAHPTTTENLRKIASFGNEIVEAREGELASGLSGQGRMAEPEELLEVIIKKFNPDPKLRKKKVLITLGPTHEAIDPVRFIGNHSSGKMGLSIAKAFRNAGSEVTLIAGPVTIDLGDFEQLNVHSASEMLEETSKRYDSCDIAVFAAAVADFRPAQPASQKIKKEADTLSLELTKNPDIALEMGKRKTHQLNIGFALETENEEEHARQKLEKKNFDLIVLNSLNDQGAGFKSDTNKVTFYDRNNKQTTFELKSKEEVAIDIVEYTKQLL
jgi:phosphopantothenoylcysteine decarboxylase/phosphopantothenate--cysteine ligase